MIVTIKQDITPLIANRRQMSWHTPVRLLAGLDPPLQGQKVTGVTAWAARAQRNVLFAVLLGRSGTLPACSGSQSLRGGLVHSALCGAALHRVCRRIPIYDQRPRKGEEEKTPAGVNRRGLKLPALT
jgi:hypothetical protein